MNRRHLLAASGVILAGLAGCLGREQPGESVAAALDASEDRIDPEAPPDDLADLARANTAFAFDLYHQLTAEEPDADHFVSPVSISMALAMTWAGARGETEAAMADALRFPFDQDTLHDAFNALDQALAARSEPDELDDEDAGDPPELNIANALWPHEGITLDESFKETLANHYGARPVALDFDDEENAAATINDWVATATEDRIQDLIDPAHLTRAILVLTNAIYFLAGWAEDFDETDTYETTFTGQDGTDGTVQMMTQAESFPYAAFDGHQAIELPYVGGNLSMLVLLPEPGAFESFEADLDQARLAAVIDRLEDTHGRIELPRFELETSYELPKHLEALGMGVAFRPEADFTGMGADAWIGNVLHDAYVAVDEEGTEAAAATAVIMVDSGPPPEAFEMVVDRPFVFAIRDRPTDSVLFLGRVVNTSTDPHD